MRFLSVEASGRHVQIGLWVATAVTVGIAMVVLGANAILAILIFAPLAGLLLLVAKPALSANAEARIPPKDHVSACLSRFLGELEHPTVALFVELDDFQKLEEQHGLAASQTAVDFTYSAIEENLTDQDVTMHLDGGRFVVALAPHGPFNIEMMLNTCTRIQHALGAAQVATSIPKPLTACIGFADSNKLLRPTADSLLQAALSALSEARLNGPSAVRAFSLAIQRRRLRQQRIARDAVGAFDNKEIFAEFQPQLNVKDGSLAGFEALARWHHPERGILQPDAFLPALEATDLMPQLGTTMMQQAIQALTFWDDFGLTVPQIGINFSTKELQNPGLVETVALYLDGHDITPNRLSIEVLETVVALENDDIITGNLAALSDLGCSIDLDDFGTGYASITNIARYSVNRIKIDRSFVRGIDRDPEQRKMVSAILTMAERLDVSTLAEGVETRADREVLEDLGCHVIQGFHLARPMPLGETVEWAGAQFAKFKRPVTLSRRAS